MAPHVRAWKWIEIQRNAEKNHELFIKSSHILVHLSWAYKRRPPSMQGLLHSSGVIDHNRNQYTGCYIHVLDWYFSVFSQWRNFLTSSIFYICLILNSAPYLKFYLLPTAFEPLSGLALSFFTPLPLPLSAGLSSVCVLVCVLVFAGGPSDPGNPPTWPSVYPAAHSLSLSLPNTAAAPPLHQQVMRWKVASTLSLCLLLTRTLYLHSASVLACCLLLLLATEAGTRTTK